MPITSITTDPSQLTLTAIGDFPVSVERLWAAWADPRQLERFWGPPTWPATFTRHELRPGGQSHYHMTGPKGETSRGYWFIDEAEAPRRFALRDGFANEDGRPNKDFPETRMEVVFLATPTGSRFVSTSTFPNLAALEQLVAMGMVEGLTAAMGQLDGVLADLRDLSREFATEATVLDDTHVQITRVLRASLQQVWRAHQEAALIRRWMLGPDGWTMPECETANHVGETYRYLWENAADGSRFGFTGELLEQEAPWRAVTTERMIGTDGPGTVNELTLTPLPGGKTRLTLVITYPSKELRDLILGTGMVGGMETSYARLEATT